MFKSEGRREKEIDRRICAVAAVMWTLYLSITKRAEHKGEAFNFYIPIYIKCESNINFFKKKKNPKKTNRNTESLLRVKHLLKCLN